MGLGVRLRAVVAATLEVRSCLVRESRSRGTENALVGFFGALQRLEGELRAMRELDMTTTAGSGVEMLRLEMAIRVDSSLRAAEAARADVERYLCVL